jgi:hypothetical protein
MARQDARDEVWLTLTEIARRLGRRLSTVASRRDTWLAHLDERRGPGRQRRYRLDAFMAMEHLMAGHADRSQIRQALDHLREVPPALGTVLDPLQAVLERIARLEAEASAIRALATETRALATEIAGLLARIAERLGLPDA